MAKVVRWPICRYLGGVALAFLCGCGQGGAPGPGTGGGPGSSPAGGGEFVGNIAGAPATARVTLETLPDYTSATIDIQSTYHYTIIAQMHGSSGYGDLLCEQTNERQVVKVDAIDNGFSLTTNPQGPGSPSVYTFTRK